MNTTVSLKLLSLRCMKESEGGSEPYIWPMMITHEDGAPILHVPTVDWAVKVLANDMKAGDSVAVPPEYSFSLGQSFDDKSKALVVFVVVLFERDALPRHAILKVLRYIEEKATALVTEKLVECRQSSGERIDLRNALVDRLDLLGVVKDDLSYLETVTTLGTPGQYDDPIGLTFWTLAGAALKNRNIDFDLSSSSTAPSDQFTLTAQLNVRIILPDKCAAQRAAFTHAQDVVKGLQGQREMLQIQLHHATPQEKSAIVAAINNVNAQLPAAEAALAQAKAALDACLAIEGGFGTNVGPAMG